MKYINTKKSPQAIGPYSQAIELPNGLIFISGQLGLDPNTMELRNGVVEQTIQSLDNIKNILEEVGLKTKDVVKTTILLADIKDFSEVNKIYESFFEGHKPARSTFAVKQLPKNGLIEIEVIAYKE